MKERERGGKISSHNPQANFQSNRTTADCPSYIVRGRQSRKISNRTLFRSCSSLLLPAHPILGYHTKGALFFPPPLHPHTTAHASQAQTPKTKEKGEPSSLTLLSLGLKSSLFPHRLLSYGDSPFFPTPGLALPSTPQTSPILTPWTWNYGYRLLPTGYLYHGDIGWPYLTLPTTP